MASPQVENGYAKMANELIEAFAGTLLTGREGQIVWAVFRLTYGYNRKMAAISYGKISKMTGIHRTKVIVLIRRLLARKVLYASPQEGTRKPSNIWINKDYSEWVHSPLEGTRVVPCEGLSDSPQEGTRKPCNTLINKCYSKQDHDTQDVGVVPCEGLGIVPCEGLGIVPCEGLGIVPCEGLPYKDKRKTKEKPLPLSIFFDPAVWEEFRKHRVELKAKMTDLAERKILDKLREYQELGHDPVDVLNNSIANGWRGVFLPKDKPVKTTTNTLDGCRIR